MTDRHTFRRRFRSIACAGAFASAIAQAGLYPTYPIGTGPGVWETDRYPPAGFSNAGTLFGRANVLGLDLSSNDSTANRPPAFSSTFYNVQGRGIQEDLAAYSVIYGSVYLPAPWATTNPGDAALNRRTEMWGVLSPATGGDTCPASACNLFPIIGFTNASASNPLSAGGVGRFRVFDSNIGFVDLATTVPYDAWSDVCMAFPGTELRFYVNGALVYTQSSLEQADTSFGPPAKWSRTTMQGYNFGTTYTANWSGLGGGKLAGASAAAGNGQTTTVGMPFATALKVVATDAGGAPLPCVPITFAAPGSGASATLSATTVVTNMLGEATVTATANALTGSYAVTATAPGLPALQFDLTNASVPPTLTKSFTPSTVEVLELSTLQITIGNATGAPFALTAPFVDSMPPGLVIATTPTGTCSGVTATQDAITMAGGTTVAAGGCTIVAQVSAPLAGTYNNVTSALVTSAGTAAAASATLAVTGSIGLSATGGGNQQATVLVPYGQPLRATVTGPQGNPVAGVVVTFTLPATGASGTFPGGATTVTAVTDAAGVATSPAITANGVAGSFTATATAPGVGGAAQYTLTNVAVAPAAPATPVPGLGPIALFALCVGIALLGAAARRRTMQ